jgi:hypothetical protein
VDCYSVNLLFAGISRPVRTPLMQPIDCIFTNEREYEEMLRVLATALQKRGGA